MIEEYSENNIVYTIDKITNEYIQESEAFLDLELSKIKGKNLYRAPEFSTFTKPPETGDNEVAVYTNEMWIIYKDFRGSIYYENNGDVIIIKEIGDTIPEWAILTPPPKTFVKPLYDKGKWIDTNKIPLKYKGHDVFNAMGVDLITTQLLNGLEEGKAKTEKLIAGDNPCPIWDKFLEMRKKILDEGSSFKKEHFPIKDESEGI